MIRIKRFKEKIMVKIAFRTASNYNDTRCRYVYAACSIYLFCFYCFQLICIFLLVRFLFDFCLVGHLHLVFGYRVCGQAQQYFFHVIFGKIGVKGVWTDQTSEKSFHSFDLPNVKGGEMSQSICARG